MSNKEQMNVEGTTKNRRILKEQMNNQPSNNKYRSRFFEESKGSNFEIQYSLFNILRFKWSVAQW